MGEGCSRWSGEGDGDVEVEQHEGWAGESTTASEVFPGDRPTANRPAERLKWKGKEGSTTLRGAVL